MIDYFFYGMASSQLDVNDNPVVTDNTGVIPEAVPITYVLLTFLLVGLSSICYVRVAMVDVSASISTFCVFALLNNLDKLFVMICLCYFWIKSNRKLLIYSTKPIQTGSWSPHLPTT